jgi:hypothetical protein
MEIHQLKMSISEQDLTDLARRHLPPDQPIENLTFRVAPEGIYVQGVYPLFVDVSFLSHWELAVEHGKLRARLAAFQAMGLPGDNLKSAVLNLLADAARTESWVRVDQDSVHVDLEGLLEHQGVKARTYLSQIVCQAGQLTLEAGRAQDQACATPE